MVPPTEAPVSTLVMPDGAVASTIQFPRHGDLGADEELTEDKIDERWPRSSAQSSVRPSSLTTKSSHRGWSFS